MTLYEYIQTHNYEEITVFDKDYDIETYFYKDEPESEWSRAMMDLAKVFEVTESMKDKVTVNMADVIEGKLYMLNNLFRECDIDAIMADIESILAGNVPESWLVDFAKALQ